MPTFTDDIFAVLGKYVKTINVIDAYIAAAEASKDEIFVEIETLNMEDAFIGVSSQFEGFKGNFSSWIQTLIGDTSGILTDEEFVLDTLEISSYDIVSVLNGLYDYMEDNGVYNTPSVVTLGGADADFGTSGATGTAELEPVLFVGRTLDGVGSPGNGVTAHIRYDGQESQLARSDTVYAKLTSNTTIGAETAQLFSTLPAVAPYGVKDEKAGVGPAISTAEVGNLIPNNFDFTNWTGDAPDDWAMSGTITTDYSDGSGAGTGPLWMTTAAVTASQQITALQHNTLYFMAAKCTFDTETTPSQILGIQLRTAADATIVTSAAVSIEEGVTDYGIAYKFFRLPTTVDLTDIFVEIEYFSEGSPTETLVIQKAVISPVTWYNGLAWAWWASYHIASDASKVPLGNIKEIAIANNDAGVFQAFFRKAFNIQLPTTGSSLINDSLAVS